MLLDLTECEETRAGQEKTGWEYSQVFMQDLWSEDEEGGGELDIFCERICSSNLLERLYFGCTSIIDGGHPHSFFTSVYKLDLSSELLHGS